MDPNQIQTSNSSNLDDILNNNPAAINSGYVAQYMTKVYGWMVLALLLTAGVAWFTASNSYMLEAIFGNRILFFGLIIGQIFLVGFLSLRIMKMSATTALLVFLAYAMINGFTFAIYLLAFDLSSIFMVFGITAGTFAVMSAIGYFTKTDLTSFGRLMIMGLIGIIIASIVNIFMHSPTLYYIISYVAVGVFVGLIAYDTQKIKAYALMDTEEDRKRGAIIGALALYLDFINLFVYLLRLLGSRR